MKIRISGARFTFGLCLAGVLAVVSLGSTGARGDGAKPEGKFMGVGTCKMCHAAKDKGAAFAKWQETKHSKAWEGLATEEAKTIAKAKGIEDPQKSDQCIKCHRTAFGAGAEQLDKKFDPQLGIQCESCHGSGEKHVKARKDDEDEDDASLHKKAQAEMALPDMKALCVKCHNSESPTIEKSPFWNKEKKEFDFEKAFKEISHPNPKWHK